MEESDLEKLMISPCVVDKFDDKCWISVLIDDLDSLEAYCGGGMFLPTAMSGWMMKVNVLVKCPVPNWDASEGSDNISRANNVSLVSGYQILSVDFEQGLGGGVKSLGARLTQRVPSTTLKFEMSSGVSGRAIKSELKDGLEYSAKVFNNKSGENLIDLEGTLITDAAKTLSSQPFIDFIINRPNKFLLQRNNDDNRLAYSPEIGDGADFPSTGCALVDVHRLAAPVADMLLGLGLSDDNGNGNGNKTMKLRLDEAICFVQPYYILVDHHNTIISSSSSSF